MAERESLTSAARDRWIIVAHKGANRIRVVSGIGRKIHTYSSLRKRRTKGCIAPGRICLPPSEAPKPPNYRKCDAKSHPKQYASGCRWADFLRILALMFRCQTQAHGFYRAIAFGLREPNRAMKRDSLEFGRRFCGGYAGCALGIGDPAVTRSGRTCARPTGSAGHGLCGLDTRLRGT